MVLEARSISMPPTQAKEYRADSPHNPFIWKFEVCMLADNSAFISSLLNY